MTDPSTVLTDIQRSLSLAHRSDRMELSSRFITLMQQAYDLQTAIQISAIKGQIGPVQ